MVNVTGLPMFLEMLDHKARADEMTAFAESHPPIQEGWEPKAWAAAEKTGVDPWDVCARIACLQQAALTESDAAWLGEKAVRQSASEGEYASLSLAIRLNKIAAHAGDKDDAPTANPCLRGIVETAISMAAQEHPETFLRRCASSDAFAPGSPLVYAGGGNERISEIQNEIVQRSAVALEVAALTSAAIPSSALSSRPRRSAL